MPESKQHDDKLFAYLDESTSANGNLTCSAAYLFDGPSAREFRSCWEGFLSARGIAYFHATDDIRRPDNEAKEIFSTLAALIKRTAQRGLVNFVLPDSVSSLHPSIRGYVGSMFSIATLGCMNIIADAAKEQKKKVVYLIENGNQFNSELRHFLSQIMNSPEHIDTYSIAVADTISKTEAIQLQAADLLAWSFGRSEYRNRWVPEIIDLVQDRALRHTMSSYDPTMLSVINSFYGLQSNRRHFDLGKRKRAERRKG